MWFRFNAQFGSAQITALRIIEIEIVSAFTYEILLGFLLAAIDSWNIIGGQRFSS